jgi:hypothetical protein
MSTSALKPRSVSGAAALLAGALSNGYGFIVAQLASLMRPQAESPAEAATRLRALAQRYAGLQPSYAADLRAAADRADSIDLR